MDGIFIIDKPAGMTSHDVVHRMRKILQERSIGHLGTLDPMATGVLPLVSGRMTRLAQFYTQSEKRYEGVIRFGFTTDTYDATGEPTSEPVPVSLTQQQLEEAAQAFRGTIFQTPPQFSAKKIAGVPAYKLARSKREVKLEPVAIEVKELSFGPLVYDPNLLSNIISIIGHDNNPAEYEGKWVSFAAHVSSGTYLRSIAHDLGQVLGCGAHLAALRRTHVAEFDITQAKTLDELASLAQSGNLAGVAIHPRRALPDLPSVTAPPDVLPRLRNGNAVNLPEMSKARLVKVFANQTELVAIASRVAGTLFQPKVVLATGAEPL
jgi:tRNA pseudouridine55 synthase